MRCEKCGNTDKRLFVKRDGKWVCRKCLIYKKSETKNSYFKGDGIYKLDYKMTQDQLKASDYILDKIKNKQDCSLNAVTGSGKTEIIYPLISYCVKSNLKIGIVIPRKDVVIELYNRLKKDFKNTSITSVYGGNTKVLFSQIIVLTSHQLYRYDHYFDVIVIDEVDAFPFNKNVVLNNFLKRSLKGNIVYMSATLNKEYLTKNTYYLNRRYHGELLDLPKIKFLFFNREIQMFLNKHKNDLVLIYFPTIKEEIKFSNKLKIKHYLINSKIENRNQILDKLHKLKKGVILTTLVLERGITFLNCHVIVYKANHNLFSYENLVQICGRVGRKISCKHGDILFLTRSLNFNIIKTIKIIKKANE